VITDEIDIGNRLVEVLTILASADDAVKERRTKDANVDCKNFMLMLLFFDYVDE